MILLSFFWFTFLYFYVYNKSKNDDLFAPAKFISLKFAFFNLPFILFIYFNPELFYERILGVCNVSLDEAILKYTIVQTVAFLSLIYGVSRLKTERIAHDNTKVKEKFDNYFAYKIIAILFFIVGITAYYTFLVDVGGLLYLLNNLTERTDIQSGQFVLFFLPFLSLSILFLLKCIALKNNSVDKILLVISIVITIVVFSSLGGRKNALYLVITIIVGYHYFFKRINLSKIKKARLVLISLLLAFYILIIPILRSKEGFSALKDNKVELVQFFDLEDLVYSISYTYIDVFACNYFNSENAWKMSSSLDIVENFTNRTLSKEQLPPIDDGVYFRTIYENNQYYKPPVARNNLYLSSWPIENFGFGYANLLILGIIIFFYFQGRIFAYAYKQTLIFINNPILVYLYVFVIFNFNFSNLRIVQCIVLTPILISSYLVYKLLSRTNEN